MLRVKSAQTRPQSLLRNLSLLVSGGSCTRRSKPRWWNTTRREALAGRRHAGHARERGTRSAGSSRGTWRREREATRRRRERKTVRRNRHAVGPGEWRHRRHASTAARRCCSGLGLFSFAKIVRSTYEGIVREVRLAFRGTEEEHLKHISLVFLIS
jgi:hypothetical protein